MSSKQTAKVSTAITAEAPPAVPATGQLPRDIALTGPVYSVFPQTVFFARLGYAFNPSMPPIIYNDTGNAYVSMTLGSPEEHVIREATQTFGDALAQEARDFDKRVEAAAKRMLADQAAAAAKAEHDAQIAEATATLAALTAAAEQRLASLKAGAA